MDLIRFGSQRKSRFHLFLLHPLLLHSQQHNPQLTRRKSSSLNTKQIQISPNSDSFQQIQQGNIRFRNKSDRTRNIPTFSSDITAEKFGSARNRVFHHPISNKTERLTRREIKKDWEEISEDWRCDFGESKKVRLQREECRNMGKRESERERERRERGVKWEKESIPGPFRSFRNPFGFFAFGEVGRG